MKTFDVMKVFEKYGRKGKYRYVLIGKEDKFFVERLIVDIDSFTKKIKRRWIRLFNSFESLDKAKEHIQYRISSGEPYRFRVCRVHTANYAEYLIGDHLYYTGGSIKKHFKENIY